MKKTGLIILIVICLIVFVSSLTAGVLLTVRSIGWQDLLDETRLQDRIHQVVNRINFLSWIPAQRESFTINETSELDLSGIRTIDITGVAESITIRSTTEAGTAGLNGSYTAVSPIRWVVETQGDVLKIHAAYPGLGVFFSNLRIAVHIPVTFSGTVSVSSVSGSISLPDTQQTDWSRLETGSISGRIFVERSAYESIKASSVSGEIVLKQISATLDCKSTSGAVKLDYTTFRDTTVRTVSGAVDITIPAQTNTGISFTTVSGRFSNQGLAISVDNQTGRRFNGTLGDGSHSLEVSTTSGAFRLKAQ